MVIMPLPIFFSLRAEGLWQNIGVITISIFISGGVIYFLGLDKGTREMVKNFMKNRIQGIKYTRKRI